MLRIVVISSLFLILCFTKGSASHLVGGEFEVKYLYRTVIDVKLNLYFDHIHGHPDAEDNSAYISVFRKKDHALRRSLHLDKVSSSFVPYTSQKCISDSIELETRLIVYATTLEIYPDGLFDGPEDYYLVWERCCRNPGIANVLKPEETGLTYYIEIPPFSFTNSSPILFPPLNDYAVVNQLYYADFGGIDPDGDSLVYSIVDPLAGNSSAYHTNPYAIPAPYETINWAEGYSLENVMSGPRALAIDSKGMITVIPGKKGLFLFAVKCEEFRNHVKIGEVRRDFQLLVIDVDVGQKPNIFAKKSGSKFNLNQGDVVTFEYNETPCIELFITDPDNNEFITLKAVSVNGNLNTENLFSVKDGFLKNEYDTLKSEVCFSGCKYKVGEIYYIDFIAMDNSCSLPLMDTVRIGITFDYDINKQPYFIEPVDKVIVADVLLGTTYELPIIGVDDDWDSLMIDAIPLDFKLMDYGMEFTEISNTSGKIVANFQFKPSCKNFDYKLRTSFSIKFIIEETGDCHGKKRNSFLLELNVIIPPGNAPEIYTDLEDLNILVEPGEEIEFTVFVKDKDNDRMSLIAYEDNFKFENHGMHFQNKIGILDGNSKFRWKVNCDNLKNKNDFLIRFVVDDIGKCKNSYSDTLTVRIQIKDTYKERPYFLPPNVFSPNEDNINDDFQLVDLLPPDDCENKFLGISIFNRWGKLVFNDHNRDFKWSGNGSSAGVYYYKINYSNWMYKGTISLIY